MKLTISEICKFADASPSSRIFIEGESLLNAGYMIFCGITPKDPANYDIVAFCNETSSLPSVQHAITGIVKPCGTIFHMKCSCEAGLGGKCKHILAVLLYCNRNDFTELESVSYDDIKCLWSTPQNQSLQQHAPRPLLEHDCYQPSISIKPTSKPNYRVAEVASPSKQADSFGSRLINSYDNKKYCWIK